MKFYTLDEVCEMLQVRPEMVWAFIQSGQLKSMRLGKRTVRIADIDLQAFVNGLRNADERKRVTNNDGRFV